MSKKIRLHQTNEQQCDGCKIFFKSSRAIQTHWQHNTECALISNSRKDFSFHSFATLDNAQLNSNLEEDLNICVGNDNEDDKCIVKEHSYELIEMQAKHQQSGFSDLTVHHDKSLVASINLISILSKAKTPLYLYDQITNWAKNCVNALDIDFGLSQTLNRSNLINQLKARYDFKCVEPKIIKSQLPSNNESIDIVVHDFTSSLYSLLNDTILMQQSNLLFMINSESEIIFQNKQKSENIKVYNDIDSGSVFEKAHATYVTEQNELLCPIIFFIDKTHTDVNGRLCLEPVRFTLGIFNRATRSNPLAWRTLGYISDISSKASSNQSIDKIKDYHFIMSQILTDFKKCQKKILHGNTQLMVNNMI